MTTRPASNSLVLSPLVDGRLSDAGAEAALPVLDPSRGETVASVPDVGARGVDMAVAAAARAQESWGSASPRDRAAALLRLADAVEQHTDELSAIESLDVGKPLHMVPAEVASAVDKIRFFAGTARQLSGVAANEYRQPLTSFIRRDPVGVVASITPWNYPLAMAIWKIAPALAAGNAVVLKPSPETPLSTLKLGEIAADILPPGVLNIVTGGADVGEALVNHPDVAMVGLTGGTATGRRVMAAAANSLKRVQLELGGNAAVLVFDDADLDKFAEAYYMAAFRNAGQDCHAASRVYASPGIAHDLTDVITSVARETRVGDPFEKTTQVGPLVSQAQVNRISGLVEGALATGHIETAAAEPVPGAGFYYPLTVLTGVRHEDAISQEEIFGPVVTISSFADEREAIARANGVSQGLAASVWTGSIDRAMRVSKALKAGTIWVNTHGATVAEMPFGGVKDSGFGTDLSVYSMEQYTYLKHVAIHVSEA